VKSRLIIGGEAMDIEKQIRAIIKVVKYIAVLIIEDYARKRLELMDPFDKSQLEKQEKLEAMLKELDAE